MKKCDVLGALSLAALASATKLLSSGPSGSVSYQIGNATYFSGFESLAEVAVTNPTLNITPLSVLKTNASSISGDWIKAALASYVEKDDVYSASFYTQARSAIAIVYTGKDSAALDESATSFLESLNLQYLLLTKSIALVSKFNATTVAHADSLQKLPPGPFAIRTTSESKIGIYKAYKLDRDEYEAYLFGTYPSEKDNSKYYPVDLFIPRYQDVWIPIPSRLWYADDNRPLAGYRMALKDIYDLKGTETGGGSRDYAMAYGTAKSTGSALQILLDAGSVVVGKTKTSQFAHGADPWQFIDIQYPWSPRGDGYLSAASSSSGTACAIAAYPYLDFGLGSDTRGSVRRPASLVGSYGIRPTIDALALDGVIPLAEAMDTAGFFCLDPFKFAQIHRVWYNNTVVSTTKPYNSFPRTIVYPTDSLPLANPAAQTIYDDFLSKLEDAYGMTVRPTNVSNIVRQSPNPLVSNFTSFGAQSNLLAEYYSWNNVGKPLAEIWAADHEGRYPTFDPNPRAAFERSFNRTEEDYAQALQTRNDFRDLFLSEIVKPSNETCSEGIFVYDIGTGGRPSYREQALNTAANGATSLAYLDPGAVLGTNYLASTSGSVDIAVPIGQVAYESVISKQTEYVPVVIQLVAHPGCDKMLIDLIEDMAAKGIVQKTKTGRAAF